MTEDTFYETIRARLSLDRYACPWPLYDMLDWISVQPGSYQWAAQFTVEQLTVKRIEVERIKHKKTSRFLLELSKQITARKEREWIENECRSIL